jgi:hypothetical protein
VRSQKACIGAVATVGLAGSVANVGFWAAAGSAAKRQLPNPIVAIMHDLLKDQITTLRRIPAL